MHMKKSIPFFGLILCAALLLSLFSGQVFAQTSGHTVVQASGQTVAGAAGMTAAQSTGQPQKRLSVGIGIEAGKLLADPGKNYKNGLGGNIMLAYSIQEEAYITLSGGYLHFGGKDYEDEYLAYSIDDWKSIPVRLGGKYFVTPNFFLKAETGAVFFLEPGSGTSLILSPGAGVRLKGFELAAKLETWTDGGTVSLAGLNLSYFF